MMLITGILIFGKMSVGVRTIESGPSMRINMARTTKVYGLCSASRTIHMIHSIAPAPSEGSRNKTCAMKHPVLHRRMDDRQSRYHATDEGVKDREDRKSTRKWAPRRTHSCQPAVTSPKSDGRNRKSKYLVA